MDSISVRIYLFTGFLESGKSTFINDTICNTNFCDNENTVLIVTEQGEVEYNAEELKKHDTDIIYVNDISEMSYEFYENIENTYHPTQILVEYNGMWNVNDMISSPKPIGYEVVQILTTINASTFTLFATNMRSQLYSHCFRSDLVIFNRMPETMKKSFIRNNMKAMNPMAQIIYEREDGTIDQTQDDELPYDYTLDSLDIKDHDFGIFCYDMMEHPDRYNDKHLRIKGKFVGRDKNIENGFVLGRLAMVCCEEDTSLIGLLCVSEYASQLIPDEWIIVEGQTHVQYDEEYGGNLCILDVDHLESTKPLQYEYVTFD